jgi:hypothetical protein
MDHILDGQSVAVGTAIADATAHQRLLDDDARHKAA